MSNSAHELPARLRRKVRCPMCNGAVWVCVNGYVQRCAECRKDDGWVSRGRAREIMRKMGRTNRGAS
jgi:hypothetical protein